MTFQDIRKGWPLIVLGLIASMCFIRGCSIIMSPVIEGVDHEGSIRHVVFLDLKPDAEKGQVIKEIRKIAGVKGLRDLEVGLFEDLGDARALSNYEVVFSMIFKNAKAYDYYQQDSLHLKLKKSLKDVLAGPPVTYDYEIR